MSMYSNAKTKCNMNFDDLICVSVTIIVNINKIINLNTFCIKYSYIKMSVGLILNLLPNDEGTMYHVHSESI